MPLDFPNPSVSTTYTDSTSGNTYTFANGSWSLTSILSATKGGTGFASYNRGDILFGNASGTLSKLGAGTAGSVLSTNGTGADPTWITLSAGGAGTVATPGARYQIAGYYPGTGASVSGSSSLTNDTSTGIVSITHATGSTSPSFGALLVSGGVGIAGTLSYYKSQLGVAGTTSLPSMAFIGNTNNPVYLNVLENNALSFEGYQGQLLSISPDLNTGYVFTVGDISGIPLLRANANANVTANEFGGNFGIGTTNPLFKLEVNGQTAITGSTASTSTTTGALVVTGGVGIGASVNIGGRVGINTGVYTGTFNITTPSASTPGIILRGSTSQTADAITYFSASGATQFAADANGRVRLTGMDGIWTTKVQQNIFDVSDARVNWNLTTWQYSNINWVTAGANITQASGQLYIYNSGTTSVTGVGIIATGWDTGGANRVFGILSPSGSERSYFKGYGNLVINPNNPNGLHTAWNTMDLITLDISGTASTYTGNIILGKVEGTNRFVVGPYGNTTVSLGGTTVSTGLIIKGASSQTGNLFEVQSSTGSTLTYIDSTGDVYIGSTVASGSTTTGALVVSGGVGIGGSLNVYNLSKFSNHLEIRSGNELRLYRTADTNYTALKSAAVTASKTFTLPLDYGTAGQFLYTTDTSGTLDWRSDPVQVSSGSVNEIAYYASAGNTVSGSSSFTNNASGGVVSITHATASTGFSSGALVVTGGVGIGGSLRIGDSTTSGGTTQGALTVRGGVGIGNNLYVGGLLSVSGTTNLFGAISFLNELSTVTFENRIIKSGSIALSMSSTNLNGAVLQIQQANIKETGIGTGSNVTSVMPAISFRKQTFSATNASITYSKAANVYIEDAPDSSVTGAVGSGGTNTVTITNSYALYVENGRTYMGGALDAPGSYRCSIGLATDQTITSNSDALVNLTSISDPNSWWNATTKRLTPTISGWYYVSFQVNWDAASITNNQCNIQMRKNGNTFSIGQMQLLSGHAYSMSCSGMVNVNGSSDYLDFTVFTANTTSQVLNGEAAQQFTRVDMFKIQ
jgi:hypothetical protein